MNKMIWAVVAVVLASASACNSVGREPAVSAAAPVASAAPASDQNVEQQVIQIVKDWIDAVPKRDTERIGQVLADDFVAILWDGKKRSKAEYLEELRSGKYA